MSGWRLIEGDCVERMRELDAASIDAVVCDPPYHLAFMGRAWDRVPTPAESQAEHHRWAVEALRVLKPGGHLLAFGGTRTYHRLACALEDAGFEVRDGFCWLYGSGFPKSHDVAKAIDRLAGIDVSADERWVATPHPVTGERRTGTTEGLFGQAIPGVRVLYDPATNEAKQWNGWGTALKPAWEPIVLARKPVTGGIGRNVLEHGTGALNVDGCRIGVAADDPVNGAMFHNKPNQVYGAYRDKVDGVVTSMTPPPGGRWPANVVLAHHPDCVLLGEAQVKANGHHPATRGAGGLGTAGHAGQEALFERHADGETVERWACVAGCAVRALDEQTHDLARAWSAPSDTGAYRASSWNLTKGAGYQPLNYGDEGGASRFFYCAKASTAERNAGLVGLPIVPTHRYSRGIGEGHDPDAPTLDRNHHPTVKPVDVMRWLVRLVTPPGGVVLDPFTGSGTTGIAACLEGVRFVGIEREPAYAEIARRRIEWWEEHGTEAIEQVRRVERAERDREAVRTAGQLDLFADA